MKTKTLKQIKEEVAKEYHFESYEEMIDYEDGFDICIIDEIAKRHANQLKMDYDLDKTLNHCLNDAFKVQELRNHPNSNNIAGFVIEWLKGKELPIKVGIKIVNLKELQKKMELANKLIKEIEGFKLKVETEVKA